MAALLRTCAALSVLVLIGGALEGETRSPRSWEVARRDCRTSYSREEVTLFRNGTVRLRIEAEAEEESVLRLAELNPSEVEAFINRLVAEDLSEVLEGRDEMLGSMIERCGLFLELPDREPQRFFFGKFDSLSLALSHLNGIVNDLYAEVIDRAPEGGLSRNYFPSPGDILERTDGHQFRVVSLTSDGRGVEMRGIDDPLTIFVALDSFRQQFVALVERREFP